VFGPFGEGRPSLQDRHGLFDWKRLAGEGGFVREEVSGLEEQAIARGRGAGREKDDVAGHDLDHGNVVRGAVPQHLGLDLDEREKLLHGSRRTSLLPEAQQAAREHDGEDDRGVRRVVEEEGDNGGTDEHENDRARKLREEEGHGVGTLLGCQPAGGVTLRPRNSLAADSPLGVVCSRLRASAEGTLQKGGPAAPYAVSSIRILP